MTLYQTDVAVIGAGTAGLAAERHAREAGAKTLLIDPAFAGTTCATVGCMPSKLLIAAADAAQAARGAERFGVRAEPRIDGPAVLQRLRALRDDFVAGVRASIARLPEGVCLTARARFEAPGRLVLDTGDR
ncbi:FAD-dependent oxidoreductase, partial [Cribrihabitans sp. XS_ASV171]